MRRNESSVDVSSVAFDTQLQHHNSEKGRKRTRIWRLEELNARIRSFENTKTHHAPELSELERKEREESSPEIYTTSVSLSFTRQAG